MENVYTIGEVLKEITQFEVIQIGLILLAAVIALSTEQRVLPWIAEKFSGRLRLNILAYVPVMRVIIITLTVILIITRIIDPTFQNLAVLVGSLAIVLGFAFREYISSLIAGITTLFEVPYRHGDWIEIDGIYGEVQSIGMRAAQILTADDTTVTIPHLKLWDTLIHNSNKGGPDLQCVADFYLHPDHDAKKVRNILYDVALVSSYLKIDQPITVVLEEKPWGTHYKIRAYPLDPRQQFLFVSDLTVRGKTELSRMGVTFALQPAVVQM